MDRTGSVRALALRLPVGFGQSGHRQKMRGNRRMQQGFPFLAPWGHLFGGRFAWPNRSSYSAALSTRIFSFLSLSSSGPCNSISLPQQEWRLHGIPLLLVPGIVASLIFLNLIHTFANCPFINLFELLYLYVLLPSYRTLFDMPIVEFGTKLCINV